jgi:hypothetical protein
VISTTVGTMRESKVQPVDFNTIYVTKRNKTNFHILLLTMHFAGSPIPPNE